MVHFKSISDLIAGLSKLKQEAWIHTDMMVWLSNPERADFYYVPWAYLQSLDDDEVFENDDGDELPLVLKDKNLKEWMLVNVLADIAARLDSKEDCVRNSLIRSTITVNLTPLCIDQVNRSCSMRLRRLSMDRAAPCFWRN